MQNTMETLSWFAGGSFILGGMVTDNQTLVDYGLSIADAAGAVYKMTTTGLAGEFVTWTTTCATSDGNACDPSDSIRITDGKYRLRPEVLETWYYAYRATRDPKYRDWAWSAFEAINRYCRTDSGFSAITNVNAADGGGKNDVQESFVFAEVLKYVYLIHLEVSPSMLNPASRTKLLTVSRMRTFRTMSKTVGLALRTLGCTIRKHIRYLSRADHSRCRCQRFCVPLRIDVFIA